MRLPVFNKRIRVSPDRASHGSNDSDLLPKKRRKLEREYLNRKQAEPFGMGPCPTGCARAEGYKPIPWSVKQRYLKVTQHNPLLPSPCTSRSVVVAETRS